MQSDAQERIAQARQVVKLRTTSVPSGVALAAVALRSRQPNTWHASTEHVSAKNLQHAAAVSVVPKDMMRECPRDNGGGHRFASGISHDQVQ